MSISGNKFEVQAPGFDQREDEMIIEYSLGYGCPVRISIVNILGEEIFSKDTQGRQGALKKQISLREFSSGMYVVNMRATEYTKAFFPEA